MKTLTYQALRFTSSKKESVEDSLTTEEALAICLNNNSLTVTMQTPGNELELTRGLLFTEGIYKKRDGDFPFEILERNKLDHITKVNVTVSEEEASVINKRTLLSVSACGICGKQELDFVEGNISSGEKFDLKELPSLFEEMSKQQSAFLSSGGCHAASSFSKNGEMLSLMEDVGRHNAVDKVIGDMLLKKQLGEAQIILVSGRVSYEIVAKAFMGGIPVLAAVSAPSTLAVDFAKELGVTLMGFCRGDRATVYAHPERIL